MDRVVIQFVLDTSANQEAIDASCRTLGTEVARCIGEVTGRTTKFVETPPAIIVADLGKVAPRQEQMTIKLGPVLKSKPKPPVKPEIVSKVDLPPSDASDPEYLTYRQLSNVFNINLHTLYTLVQRNKIPHIRLGPRSVRFEPAKVREWLRKSRVKAKSYRTNL